MGERGEAIESEAIQSEASEHRGQRTLRQPPFLIQGDHDGFKSPAPPQRLALVALG